MKDILNFGFLCALGTLVLVEIAAAGQHPCASVSEPKERLACYDGAFPPTTGAVVRADPPRRSEDELRAEFGLSIREVDERKPAADREPQIESLEALIVSVRAVQGGQRVLGLDNGQTWQLTEGGTRGPLKPGDQISIRRGAFGSFLLRTPAGVGLRTRRVN